jgi:nucleoside-diphosphate-sugar epimerase
MLFEIYDLEWPRAAIDTSCCQPVHPPTAASLRVAAEGSDVRMVALPQSKGHGECVTHLGYRAAVSDGAFDVVTGAFSYTGAGIARALRARGRTVRTLTGHPHRPGADPHIEARPYAFENPDELRRSLEGADTLYNTYWVRFTRGDETFERAIERSAILFRAAESAGIRRVVHISVTHPDQNSSFPYFRGKAMVEQLLAKTCDSWAIIRPTLIFGQGDILMNNVAWLLRRLPIFALAGDAAYRVRPVHVDDVADLSLRCAVNRGTETVDAVGLDTFTFEELVLQIRGAVGSHARLVHVDPRIARLAASMIGLAVRDVLVTDHELGGLMAEKAYSDAPTTGERRFAPWVRDAGPTLGLRYESEMRRHFG